MPQGGPQATPPFVPEKSSAKASTTSKTTTSTVPVEVADAFKGFLTSVFGANPTTGAPGAAPGLTTPAVVGGLPPQLTPSSPLSTPAPVPLQSRQAVQSVRGIAPAGTQYQSGAARDEAATASFGRALVSAIDANKNKKDEDNIARAQNTMNTFLHAVQQNDMATANLYASDPKITGMWEKYLKQEYKRLPASPKSEATPKENLSSGLMPTQSVPQNPVEGQINQPGGIAIPRDMTPEGQIRQRQLAAVNDVMSKMSPEQVAATASVPGVNMDASALSSEEFKKYTQSKYGLALTKEQDMLLDSNAKIAQANAMADVYKYTVGQVMSIQRAEIAAGGTVEAANKRAAGALAVMKEHNKGLKDVQNLKGMGLTTALYQQQMKMYQQMADDFNKKLADPSYGINGLWWKSDAERKTLEAQRDDWLKKANDAKTEWEGFKFVQENFPELADATPDAIVSPEPEQ